MIVMMSDDRFDSSCNLWTVRINIFCGWKDWVFWPFFNPFIARLGLNGTQIGWIVSIAAAHHY